MKAVTPRWESPMASTCSASRSAEVPDMALTAQAGCSSRWIGDGDG
jgi:hypothetical protein